MATSPFEIIAGPAEAWVAAVGESFPDVDTADPTDGTNWIALGDTEGGVNSKHGQTIELIRTDQSTGPKKAIRTEEVLEITTQLAELTLENFAIALNDATVTEVSAGAGQIGTKAIPLMQGLDVSQFALLVRGPSPYGDFDLQYQVPIVVQIAEPEPAFTRDDKAVLGVTFTALEDPDASSIGERFGKMLAQTAAASS